MEIIFRDKNFVTTGNRTWTLATFTPLIKGLSGFYCVRDRLTKFGISHTYSTEDEVNLFLCPNMLKKLKELNIDANLSPASKSHREIYVPDIPEDIFSYSRSQIYNEAVAKNNITLIDVISFPSYKGNYFVFTATNKLTKDRVINNGHMELFGHYLPVECKRTAGSPPTNRGHFPTGPPPNAPRAIPHGSAPRPISNFPPLNHGPPHSRISQPQSTQHVRAIPPSCNWAHEFNQGLIQQPPVTSANNNQFEKLSDNEIKLYAYTKSRVFEVLSEGLEEPELYISLINESNSLQGLPIIPVSNSATNLSKQMYISKNRPNFNQSSTPPSCQTSEATSINPASSTPSHTPDTHTRNIQTPPLVSPSHLNPIYQSSAITSSAPAISTSGVSTIAPLSTTFNTTSTPSIPRQRSSLNFPLNQTTLFHPSSPLEPHLFHNHSLPSYPSSISTPTFLQQYTSINPFPELTSPLLPPNLPPLQEYRICTPDTNSINLKFQKVVPRHSTSTQSTSTHSTTQSL